MIKFALKRIALGVTIMLGSTVLIYALLLAGILGAAAWVSFSRFVLGKAEEVPDLTGRSVDEATAQAAERGLRVVVDRSQEGFDEEIPFHRIRGQSPAAGIIGNCVAGDWTNCRVTRFSPAPSLHLKHSLSSGAQPSFEPVATLILDSTRSRLLRQTDVD